MHPLVSAFFFFNDTATTEIYTLSLHDALPIYWIVSVCGCALVRYDFRPRRHHHRSRVPLAGAACRSWSVDLPRSEEHTSELQSHLNLVCRLLLEKKKKQHNNTAPLHRPTPLSV